MKPKTDAPPNLLKPWPASLDGLLCAKCSGGGMDALCAACARSEVRRLRGEVRRLRRVIQGAAADLRKSAFFEDQVLAGQLEAALAPRRRKK